MPCGPRCGAGLCVTITTLLLVGAPVSLIVALVYGSRAGNDPFGSNVDSYNAAVRSWKAGSSFPFLVTEGAAMVRGVIMDRNLTFQLAPVADPEPLARAGPVYADLEAYDSLGLSARLLSVSNGSGMFPDQYVYPSQYAYSSQYIDLYLGQATPTRVSVPIVAGASMPAVCPPGADYFNNYAGCTCSFGFRPYGYSTCLITLQLTGMCIVVDPAAGSPAAGSLATAGCAPLPILPDGKTVYSAPYTSTCLPSGVASGTSAYIYTPVNLTKSATLSFTNFTVELRSSADPHAVALGLTRGSLNFGSSPDDLARAAAIAWFFAGFCGAVAFAVVVCVASPVCDRGVANARSYLAARRARLEMQQAAAAVAAGPRLHMTDREEAALQAALIGVPDEVPAWGAPAPAAEGRGGAGRSAGLLRGTLNGGALAAAAAVDAGAAVADVEASDAAAAAAAAGGTTEWQIFLRRMPAPAGLVSEAEWAAMSTADREIALGNLAPAVRFAVLRFAPGAAQAGMNGPQRFLATFGAGRNEGECADRTRAAVALPAAVALDLVGVVQTAYRARWPCCTNCFGVPYIIRSAWSMALVSLCCTIASIGIIASLGGRGGAAADNGFITVMRRTTGNSCAAPYISSGVNLAQAVAATRSELPALGLAFRLQLAGVIIPLPTSLLAFVAVVCALSARRPLPRRVGQAPPPPSPRRRIVTTTLVIILALLHVAGTLCTSAAVGMLELTDLRANAAAAYCSSQLPTATSDFYCLPGDKWEAQYVAAPYVQAAASFMLCWGAIIVTRT